MNISHTLLGSSINGQDHYQPLNVEAKFNSKMTLAGIEIPKDNNLYAEVVESGEFSLNVFSGPTLDRLGINNPSLSKRQDCECLNFNGILDAPLLKDAPLAVECRVYEIIDLGDKSFFMTEIFGIWSLGNDFMEYLPEEGGSLKFMPEIPETGNRFHQEAGQ